MRVGPDQRIGECALHPVAFLGEDHARKVLEIDLVNDAGVWRHDLEVAERRLPPAQERIALAVARELDGVVAAQRVLRSVLVHLHGMIDHELRRRERVDFLRVAAETRHGLAHRREIDDGGDTREVLHDHACRREGDLVAGRGMRIPAQQRLDVGARHAHAVLEAQQVFEQDLEREGQATDVVSLDGAEALDLVGLATRVQGRAGPETVLHGTSGGGRARAAEL